MVIRRSSSETQVEDIAADRAGLKATKAHTSILRFEPASQNAAFAILRSSSEKPTVDIVI
jgi:hypothetical protein